MIDLKLFQLLKKKYEEQQKKRSVIKKSSDNNLSRISSGLRSIKKESKSPIKSLTSKFIVDSISKGDDCFNLSKSLKFQRNQTVNLASSISPFQRTISGKTSSIFSKLESENKKIDRPNSRKSTSLNESIHKSRQNSSMGSQISNIFGSPLKSPNDDNLFNIDNFVKLEYLKNFTVK